jgi:hypothetical protein
MKHPLLFFLSFCLIAAAHAQSSTPVNIVRYVQTPETIPSSSTISVLLEVVTKGNSTDVRLSGGYNQPELPLNDRGVDGDKKAGDGIFSILVAPPEYGWNIAMRGWIRTYENDQKVDEVGWYIAYTPSANRTITVRQIDSTTQFSDYVFNMVVPSTLTSLSEAERLKINQTFYKYHADEFDFINYVLIPGFVGPVSHTAVANNVTNIGLPQFNNSAKFGSRGRLKGLIEFPISRFFDGAGRPFLQAIGRQWITPTNPLRKSPGPNWPISNLAAGVMGFGPEGKAFPYEFDNYNGQVTLNGTMEWHLPLTLISPTPRSRPTLYNEWELYLMGLLLAGEVKTKAAIFKDQTLSTEFLTWKQYSEASFDQYTLQEAIATTGERTPTPAQSQKRFAVATIVLSEKLLTRAEMARFDEMTRRAEGQEPVYNTENNAFYFSRPFGVATGGRATMRTLLNTNANCASLPDRPTITTGLGATVCQGQLTTLTTSLPPSSTAIWYWNGTPLPQRTASVTAAQAGEYTVSVRDEKGCNSPVSAVLSLSSVLVPFRPGIAFISNDVATAMYCHPGYFTTDRNRGPYQWFLNGQPIDGATTYQLSPRVSGNYSVAVRYAGGCTDIRSASQSITVGMAGKTPELLAEKTTFVCGDDRVKLQAVTDSKNPHKWYWYRNEEFLTQTTSATFYATATGDYTAQLIEETSCPSWPSKAVSLTANVTQTKPVITTAVNGLQSSSSGGNQWFSNGWPITNATGQTYSTPYNGVTYTVQVNNGGCLTDSDPLLYNGPSVTSAPQPQTVSNPTPTTTATTVVVTAQEPVLPVSPVLSHAPNPVSQAAIITIKLPKPTTLTLRLLSSTGLGLRVLLEGRYAAGEHTVNLDTTSLPPGLYLYRLETENGALTNKLLVTR